MALTKSSLVHYVFVGILIVPLLDRYITPLSFYDEFLTIISLFIIFNSKANKKLRPVMYYMTAILLIGVASTMYYQYQTGLEPIYKDVIAISKFPIVLYGFSVMNVNKDLVIKKTEKISRLFSVVFFTFGFISFAVDLGMSQDEIRYGFHPYKFLYAHPTFLVMELVILLAVLIASDYKGNRLYILLNILTMILTFRTKAVVVIAVLVVFFMGRSFGISKYRKTLLFFSVIGILLITYYFAVEKISDYTSEQYQMDAARTVLTYSGFKIAQSHFPLGTGFCTFGSYLSAAYYSPLYSQYRLDYLQGLEKGDISFAADVFWPSIYVQYSFIGAFLYLLMLWVVIRYVNKTAVFFSDRWVAAYIVILYALAASTSEAVFTNTSGVFFPIVVILCLGNVADLRPQVQQSVLVQQA